MDFKSLQELCKLIRYDILTATTAAGSGHPTSSLSAVELTTALFFGGFFRQDLDDPKDWNNDRFVLSKGHAAPLLYSLYQAAGRITHEELLTLRKFGSKLQGHPTPDFPYADVATGALGQGLSIGLGMALGIKLREKQKELKVTREPKVFVLMGDSEFAEGQIYEAMELASTCHADNLVGILDVNRLGQRGETMLGWNISTYQRRITSFGWNTIVLDSGHDLDAVYKAFEQIEKQDTKCPTMIISKTIKGKGISFLEDKDGWHGKAVPKDKLQSALKELGKVDLKLVGKITKPEISEENLDLRSSHRRERSEATVRASKDEFSKDTQISTREAYGAALELVGQTDPNLVVLDAEVSNSTFAEVFKNAFPHRYFEMFIAEENMISTAVGLSKIGFVPFASTFAAFLTNTTDQIRMAAYSNANIKIVGSHAGVSIGQDGPSQMGLEDIGMLRAIKDSIVFHPSDAVSTKKLVELMAQEKGLFYLRTIRPKTPILYKESDMFEIGGSKLLRSSDQDIATIIAAGITLHEGLKAQEQLAKDGIHVAVVDLYSIKPLDVEMLRQQASHTTNLIIVEDHYSAGGIGEAVAKTLLENKIAAKFSHLCVRKTPQSGTPEELISFEEIDAAAIIKTVEKLV